MVSHYTEMPAPSSYNLSREITEALRNGPSVRAAAYVSQITGLNITRTTPRKLGPGENL